MYPVIDIIKTHLVGARPLFQKIDCHIGSNGVQPSVEAGFSLEPFDRSVRFGENILKEIASVLMIRGHVVDEAVKARTVLAHQVIEGTRISPLGQGNQIFIKDLLFFDDIIHNKLQF